MVTIKFKKAHPDAQLPSKNHDTDTGYDIFAVESKIIPAKSFGRPYYGEPKIGCDEIFPDESEQDNNYTPGCAEVDTGLQVAYITPGYWYQISPRSGLGFKHGIQPHLGVIDQTYRGSLGIKLYNFSDKDYSVQAGDRIAQLILHQRVDAWIDWSDEVENTSRGSKGFGSSGK